MWDKPEIIPYIEEQPRLLRPLNMPEATPGNGVVTHTNDAGKRLTVVNVMQICLWQRMTRFLRCLTVRWCAIN